MSFAYQKEIFLVIIAVIIVVIAFPFIQQALVDKKPEPNSELWLLGQQHTADNYPFNIKSNQNYTVFIDVKNNLGDMVQYMIRARFLNMTQRATASPVPSIYSSTAAVEDGATWAFPITFSIDYAFDEATFKVNLNSISVNNMTTNASDISVAWDSDNEGRFGYLDFELWIYDNDAREFKNHGRSVDLRLNMTAP